MHTRMHAHTNQHSPGDFYSGHNPKKGNVINLKRKEDKQMSKAEISKSIKAIIRTIVYDIKMKFLEMCGNTGFQQERQREAINGNQMRIK